MFGPPGLTYVHRSHGSHWRLNLVCGRRPGGAVLFRALEPTRGLERMVERRGVMDVRRLAAGPGRPCQALGVGAAQNGSPMTKAAFHLELADAPATPPRGPRIGISKAVDQPWRFGLAGSRSLAAPWT